MAEAKKEPAKRRAGRAAAAQARRAGEEANAFTEEDPFLTAMAGTAGLMTSAESEDRIIGLRLPSLALCVLFQQDVLALGRSMMIVGHPGTCKSAFLYEMYRWFCYNEGGGLHIDNENKDAPSLRTSVLEHNDVFSKVRVKAIRSHSQEQWMGQVNDYLHWFDDTFAREIPAKKSKQKEHETAEAYKKRMAPKVNARAQGYVRPAIIGIDSLTATSSDNEIQKIKDSGAPERGFSWEAQAIAKFGRTIPTRLDGRPLILAFNNHLKHGTDGRGRPTDVIPGGWAMRYMDTLEVKLEKFGGYNHADEGGVTLKMSLPKNSLGATGGSIMVTFKWWWEMDPATGRRRQVAVWDWETAAIDCLLSQKAVGAARWKEVQAICDLHEASQKRVWSKELGIPEGKPVKYHVAGKMLQERAELMDLLFEVLHVARRTVFVPGVPFEDVKEQLRRSGEASRVVYSPRDLSGGDAIDLALEEQARKKAEEPDDDDD